MRISFFIGKGGVGKTTVASSYAALQAASSRNRVLLLSTDPAHSLGDVFQLRLADKPRRIAAGLFASQLDAQRRFAAFLRRHRSAILEVVERGTIFKRDEIEPLLDTTLPGMAEIAALLAISDLVESADYEELVIDSAPIGHTLRLFDMPQQFRRFLDFLDLAASRDQVLAEHFGGGVSISAPFLDDWRRRLQSIERALSREGSRLVLVTTPESFALNESLRVSRDLPSTLRIESVVLNRAVPRSPDRCPRCAQRVRATRAALTFLERHFRHVPVLMGEDSGAPILGARHLLAFGRHVFRRGRAPAAPSPPARHKPQFEAAEWPRLKTPLSLTLGKGGVGKTTVSAALAVHERSRRGGRPVVICSTDPAPSLDDVFQTAVGDRPRTVLGDRRLRALEMDSAAAFRTWSARIRTRVEEALTSEQRGVHVELSFDRQVFAALLDIVPPGVDEIFAVFRILDLVSRGRERVVIDMAPTGHALELLRMPERILRWSRLLMKALAAHRALPMARDAAVEIAEVSQRVREITAIMKDSARARIWPVMQPEPLPDRQTLRLMEALDGLEMPARALFVNRVLIGDDPGRCRRCRRRQAWQFSTLAGLGRRYRDMEIFVVRDFPHEIAGAEKLRHFTKELWRLQ